MNFTELQSFSNEIRPENKPTKPMIFALTKDCNATDESLIQKKKISSLSKATFSKPNPKGFQSSIFGRKGSKSKLNNFHEKFYELRKALNMDPFLRKTQLDTLLKKTKSKTFRIVNEIMKKCLKITLPRLPQTFVANVNINFNKIYLKISIYDIYIEHNLIPSYKELIGNNLIHENCINLFLEFVSKSYMEIVQIYLNSNQYLKDYLYIKSREGEKFAILYNYISKIFIEYYSKSKGYLTTYDKCIGLSIK